MVAGLLSPARAAYWAVTYQCSGNNTGTSVNGQPINSPWVINPHMPNAGQGYGIWEQGTATGSITPTLTWTLGSGETVLPPAPKQIFVEMDTSASAHLSWSGTASSQKVQASDSLDGSGTPVLTAPGSEDCAVAGTHNLMVANPTALTVVPLTAVSGTAVSSITAASSGAADFVGVKATVFPLIVTLGGAILDSSGNYNILVGQGCASSFAIGPDASGNSFTGIVKFISWSVSGTTFQSWSPTTPQIGTTPANPNASHEVDGPGPLTNATAHWYWNDFGPDPTQEKVTCTATVTPPTGQGTAFSVTAPQNVMVYVPVRSTNTNTIGDGRFIQGTIIAKASPGMINNLLEFGSSWTTSVSLPTTPSFGIGQWCYAQLITPGEYLAIDGVLQTSTDTTRGDGLDASFPYVSSQTDTCLQATDGIKHNEGDSPRLSGINSPSIDSVTLTDTLHTYVMFKPLGTDVSWVPLSETHWDTDFIAHIPAGGWAAFSPNESVGPINLEYDFVRVNKFPMWTQIVPSGAAFIHP